MILAVFAFCATFQIAAAYLEAIHNPHFEVVWNDKGSGGKYDVSVWRQNVLPSPFFRPGHFIGRAANNFCTHECCYHIRDDNAEVGYWEPWHSRTLPRGYMIRGNVTHPQSYTRIWTDAGSGANWDGAVWRPNCQPGYVALGHVMTRNHGPAPPLNEMGCVSVLDVQQGNFNIMSWNDRNTGANTDVSFWHATTPSCESQNKCSGTFYAHTSYGTLCC